MQPKQIAMAKALRAPVVVPAPVVPAQTQATAKTAMFGKLKPAHLARASRMYGTGQPDQAAAFGQLRDATATGSLRKFLKRQNEAAGVKGLRQHHATSPKPAIKPASLN